MRDHVDGTFMLTYGNGVADVDIDQLLAFHRSHGKLATVTAARPAARFGGLLFDGNRVAEFKEKSQLDEGWINGGFFLLDRRVMDYLAGDDIVFEREPREALADDGQLLAYRHPGFWQPMDTLREVGLLNQLWESGKAPWKIWDDAHPANPSR
jgi:glucose-1-phosphate cytidylyltransferase